MWFVLSAIASPWIPPQGQVRLSAGYQQLVTERQFASPEAVGRLGPRCPDGVGAGDRMPFDCTTGGRFANRSLSLGVTVAPVEHLAIDLYLPVVLAAFFEDEVGRTDARGLGDVRLAARAGQVWGGVAVAGTLELKAPTGPAGLVDRDVPLGDAQWDLIPGVRVGTSLHPWGWLELHNQLVWRLRSARSGIDPGEEWTGSVVGGFTPVEWGGLQGRGEWILALPDTDAFGLSHPGRRLLQVRAGPFVKLESVWVEVSVTLPVVGRRWPTAPSVGASMTAYFDGFSRRKR